MYDIVLNLKEKQNKTKDVYFVFYERMLQALSTIASFSDFDLNTGEKDKDFLIKPFKLQKFIKDKSYVALDWKIDARMKIADGKNYPLKEISYVSSIQVQKISTIYGQANVSAIIYNKRYVFILKNKTLDTFLCKY